MIELTKSRFAMAIVWLAATLVTIAILLEGLAFVLLSPTDQSTSSNLNTAYAWVFFAGWAVAVVALLMAAWILCLRRHWAAAGEVGVLSLATIVIAIGALYGGVDCMGRPRRQRCWWPSGSAGGSSSMRSRRPGAPSSSTTTPPRAFRGAVVRRRDRAGVHRRFPGSAVARPRRRRDGRDAGRLRDGGMRPAPHRDRRGAATSAIKSPQTVFAAIGLALLALGSLGQAVTSEVVLRSPSSYSLNGFRIGISAAGVRPRARLRRARSRGGAARLRDPGSWQGCAGPAGSQEQRVTWGLHGSRGQHGTREPDGV